MNSWIKSIAIIATSTLFLGGCSAEKSLKAENEGLRKSTEALTGQVEELNQKLEMEQTARREAESKKQAMEGEITTLRTLAAQPPAPAPGYDPMAGGGSSGGGGKRSGGSEGNGGGVVITVAGDVAFGPGQATLTAAGKKELDQIAREISRKYSGKTIRVEGYTDSDPVKRSKWGSNQALSQARADAVEKYLISKGVSSGRISAVGMGSKNAKSSKAASRRVEIVIVGG